MYAALRTDSILKVYYEERQFSPESRNAMFDIGMSTVVGGLLFGVVGAAIGGMTAKMKSDAPIVFCIISYWSDDDNKKDKLVLTCSSMDKKDMDAFFLDVCKGGIVDTVVRVVKPEPPKIAVVPQSEDSTEKIRKLAKLRDEGILTEEEFTAKKTELLLKM